jgi:hypothetical protein
MGTERPIIIGPHLLSFDSILPLNECGIGGLAPLTVGPYMESLFQERAQHKPNLIRAGALFLLADTT